MLMSVTDASYIVSVKNKSSLIIKHIINAMFISLKWMPGWQSIVSDNDYNRSSVIAHTQIQLDNTGAISAVQFVKW